MSTPLRDQRLKMALHLKLALAACLGAFVLTLLFHSTPVVSAQATGTTISSTSGPVSWDFGPVVAGTVTNVGIQDNCPPGLCDNHDLTIVLPAPAASFYQNNTVQVTIKYTWN